MDNRTPGSRRASREDQARQGKMDGLVIYAAEGRIKIDATLGKLFDRDRDLVKEAIRNGVFGTPRAAAAKKKSGGESGEEVKMLQEDGPESAGTGDRQMPGFRDAIRYGYSNTRVKAMESKLVAEGDDRAHARGQGDGEPGSDAAADQLQGLRRGVRRDEGHGQADRLRAEQEPGQGDEQAGGRRARRPQGPGPEHSRGLGHEQREIHDRRDDLRAGVSTTYPGT